MVNCATAVLSLDALSNQCRFPVSSKAVKQGLEKVSWPGRCQVLSDRPLVLLDCAHNPGGAGALKRALKALCPNRKIALVAGFAGDKDYLGFLNTFKGLDIKVWGVPIGNPRSLPVEDILKAGTKLEMDVSDGGDLTSAIQVATTWARQQNGVICIAGSLYLAADMLKLLEEGKGKTIFKPRR